MYLSAGPVALVPPGVVTVTSTFPMPAGAVAVTEVSDTGVNPVAGELPKCTALAPVRPVPVMVTRLPPARAPAVGDNVVTVGMGA